MDINGITAPATPNQYDADIAIAKEASRLHLWRDLENQHRNFSTFILNLCNSHGCAAPSLDVDPGTTPQYLHEDGSLGHIVLDRYSVVSMLHELGHHFLYDEATCVTYSEWVFANAFPVSFSRLERDARGYLCKPGTGVAAPVFYNTGEYGLANTDSPATINTETM